MAKTKTDIQAEGRAAQRAGAGILACPYKAGSWQATAWEDGHAAEKAESAPNTDAAFKAGGEARRKGIAVCPPQWVGKERLEWDRGWHTVDRAEFQVMPAGSLTQMPQRMPQATREHIKQLDTRARGETCSTTALRLDRKISKLVARWA